MYIYFMAWLSISCFMAFSVKENISKNLSGFCALTGYFVYILFAIFRKIDIGYGGTDAIAYYTFFMQASMPYMSYITSIHPEFGFSSILWILHRITNNYVIVLWIFHSFTYVLLLKFIRYIRCSNIIAVMLLNQVLFSQFNTLRMSICIAIALYILILLDESKFFNAIIWALLAISIHKSAAILLPMILANLYFRNKTITCMRFTMFVLIYSTIAFVLYIMIVNYFSTTKYSVYFSGNNTYALGSYLFIVVMIMFSVMKYQRLTAHNRINRVILISMVTLPICFMYNYHISIFYRVMLILLQFAYALFAIELKSFTLKSCSPLFLLFTLSTMYMYSIIRIYRFFSTEVQYIGIPYVSTLFF